MKKITMKRRKSVKKMFFKRHKKTSKVMNNKDAKTTDWKFDFSSLPHWDNREEVLVYDEFFEIPQNDTLCCIYSIAEVGMLNYRGFLAILKNKSEPFLFLNIAEGFNFVPNFSVSKDGNLIFLVPNIYCKKRMMSRRPMLIINLRKNSFAYIDTNNTNPCFKVVEIKKNLFAIDADKHQIKYDERLRKFSRRKIMPCFFKWYDLSELESLPEILSK